MRRQLILRNRKNKMDMKTCRIAKKIQKQSHKQSQYEVYDDFYANYKPRNGENGIYKLAKVRGR